ncbi:unnamed protein product, partial [Didymodactylos carnosus]
QVIKVLVPQLSYMTQLSSLTLRMKLRDSSDTTTQNAFELVAAFVVNELKANNTLTQLALADNQISERGVEALAEALKINHTLTQLDLSSNRMSDRGEAQTPKVNNTLTQLYLRGNPISVNGSEEPNCWDVKLLLDPLLWSNSATALRHYVSSDVQEEKDREQKDEQLLKREKCWRGH